MAANQSSYGGNGPVLLWLLILEWLVTTVVMGLRFYSSLAIVRRVRADMYCITVAYALSLVALIFGVLAIQHGIGNHVVAVRPEDLSIGFLYDWIYNCATIMSVAVGKIAVVALILQVQEGTHRNIRYFLIFLAATSLLLSTALTILIWFECTPSHLLWTDPSNKAACPRVVPATKFGTFIGGWSAASDFILAACPAWVFWQLNMSRKRRLTLIGLFCGGVIAGVSAIMKTVYIVRTTATTDPNFEITPLLICSATEMYLIIITSSIPALSPLIKTVIKKRRAGSPGRTSGRTWPYATFESDRTPYDLGNLKEAGLQAHEHRPDLDHVSRAVTSRKVSDDAVDLLPGYEGRKEGHTGIMMTRSVDMRDTPRKVER